MHYLTMLKASLRRSSRWVSPPRRARGYAGWTAISVLALSGALLCAGATAASASVVASGPKITPGPQCSVSVGTPYVSAPPTPFGTNQWTFTASVEASIACKTAQTKLTIVPVFYWKTFVGTNNSGPALGSGEVSGNAGICDGSSSCSAIANYTRVLSCNTPYFFEDYGEGVVTYEGVTVTNDGSQATYGYAENPPGTCGNP